MIQNKVTRILNDIEKYLIAILFTVLTIIVVFQVITRYGFGFTIAWLEQFARLIFVWLSFIGISYAAMHSQHIRMTAVATLFKGKARIIFMLIGDIVCIAMSAYLAYKIGGLTAVVYTKKQCFSAMPFMPIWVMYISGVFGMLGLGIRTIQFGLILDLKNLRAESNK